MACLHAFSGIGKLKEIFIVTAYSLIPMTVFIFLRVIMSHFMSMSGLAFLNGLQAVLVIYTFFLLSIGIMTVQEYNFFKFSGTGILTVFGMIMVVFVLFMVIILLQQSWNFVYSLIIEVAYR